MLHVEPTNSNSIIFTYREHERSNRSSQKLRDLAVLRTRAHRWGIYRDSPHMWHFTSTLPGPRGAAELSQITKFVNRCKRLIVLLTATSRLAHAKEIYNNNDNNGKAASFNCSSSTTSTEHPKADDLYADKYPYEAHLNRFPDENSDNDDEPLLKKSSGRKYFYEDELDEDNNKGRSSSDNDNDDPAPVIDVSLQVLPLNEYQHDKNRRNNYSYEEDHRYVTKIGIFAKDDKSNDRDDRRRYDDNFDDKRSYFNNRDEKWMFDTSNSNDEHDDILVDSGKYNTKAMIPPTTQSGKNYQYYTNEKPRLLDASSSPSPFPAVNRDEQPPRLLDDLLPDDAGSSSSLLQHRENFERRLVDHHYQQQQQQTQQRRYNNNYERPIYSTEKSSKANYPRRLDVNGEPKYERRSYEDDDLHPERRLSEPILLVDSGEQNTVKSLDDHVHQQPMIIDEDHRMTERRKIPASSPDRRISSSDDNNDNWVKSSNTESADQDNDNSNDTGEKKDGPQPDRRYDDVQFFQPYPPLPLPPRRGNNDLYNNNNNMMYNRSSSYGRSDWELATIDRNNLPRLHFPRKAVDERYRMASLHLDRGLFVFDFLRSFLRVILPRSVPLDLLKDSIDGRIELQSLLAQSVHFELVFLCCACFLGLMMLVVPSTECWLCCCGSASRRKKNHYSSSVSRAGSPSGRRRTGSYCCLATFAIILGACGVTMLVCNEQLANGLELLPETLEAGLQDLRDYHQGGAGQLRKCLTRSLDVASEAILADLDRLKLTQIQRRGATWQAGAGAARGRDRPRRGTGIADGCGEFSTSSEPRFKFSFSATSLENSFITSGSASHELSYQTEALLQRAERAREFGAELGREADELRRELERATRDCSHEDRSLCAVIDPSGLHLALRLDRPEQIPHLNRVFLDKCQTNNKKNRQVRWGGEGRPSAAAEIDGPRQSDGGRTTGARRVSLRAASRRAHHSRRSES
ncbi:unnamed protein product [Trichogramma brassicae]|uniref:Uncharacterized protein n=1 Tax=Trichogramma brassicae TaxID=86971 RepID=A0A6H5I519_9HYME|nr:unnamed protein product [Trichogramma brassicae]